MMIKKFFDKFCKVQVDKDIMAQSGKDTMVIVDVGCRWGFADKFSEDIAVGNITVFGFDPDKDECARLKEIYKDNANVNLVPLGLSSETGKRKLYLTKEPACSSLYEPIERLTKNYPALDCAKKEREIEVELTTLDSWASNNKVNKVDYIKIDTQGAELNILKGATSLLSTIRFLEVEVEFNPIYEGQPIFSDVDYFLRKYGFVLWRISNIVHYALGNESEIKLKNDTINFDHYRIEHETRGGQLYWADAFYVKESIVNVDYSGESKEQIRNDAILAERLGLLDLSSRLKSALVQERH